MLPLLNFSTDDVIPSLVATVAPCFSPGAEALAQGMEQNSWLEELDLSKNHIKMLGPEWWWLGEGTPYCLYSILENGG